jgi:hypothetical protein
LQDAFTCFVPENPLSPFFAAVSDGAGSALCGGQGASLVCRSISVLVRAHFHNHHSLPSNEQLEEWLDRTRDLIFAVAAKRAMMPRDFASTLICLISDGRETIVAHVGDGCAVAKVTESEEWIALSWPDHGEYASTTFFVSDEGGVKLRITRHVGEISAIALLSDGLERLALDFSTNVPFKKFFDGVISPLTASSIVGKDRDLCAKLKSYLAGSAVIARTDDDKSLILAVRR